MIFDDVRVSQLTMHHTSTLHLPTLIFEYNSFARKEVKHTIKKGKDEYDLFLSVSVSEEDSCCTIKAKSM